MTVESPTSLIPVTLLTGFLGSGKTTVLNHLVRQPELADALVIINEVGELALDHLLIVHCTENLVMEMSSGCLCCTIRGDLVKTLRDITWRFSRNAQRQFRRVLIRNHRPSGSGTHHPYADDPSAGRAEVPTRWHRHDRVHGHRHAHPGQLPGSRQESGRGRRATADQSRSVSDEQRQALLRRLDGTNPTAPRWGVQDGEIAPQKVLNLGLFSADGKTPDVARWLREEAYAPVHEHAHAHAHAHHEHDHGHAHDHHDVNRHDDHIIAFCFHVDDPIPDEVLTNWLELLMAFVGSNILRVKGILNVEGSAQPIVVHGVQHIFHPPVPLPAWPSEDRRSRLVFITQDVDREVVERTFEALRQALPQAGESTA